MSVQAEARSWLPDLVAGVFCAGLFGVNIVADVDEPVWLTSIGLICFLIAIPFVALPFLHLARYGKPKPGDAFFETTQVADRGVYALVRHPQYLGYMFLVSGFACLDPHPVAVGFAALAIVSFYLQCLVEERFCLEFLGTDYGEYKTMVPRINVFLGLYRLMKRKSSKV